MTDDHIDALLRAAREDTAPLRADLRARILADVPRPATPARDPGRKLAGWFGGLVAMPGAALLGLWLGLAQPVAILGLVPGTEVVSGEETALLDDVFGTVWADAGETE